MKLPVRHPDGVSAGKRGRGRGSGALTALLVAALPVGLAVAEGKLSRDAEAAGVWLDEGYALTLCGYADSAQRIVEGPGDDPAVVLKYARVARGLADEAAKWSGGKTCRQLWDEQQAEREAAGGRKAADTFGEPLSCSELREAEGEAACVREAVATFGEPLSCSELQELKGEVQCRSRAADTIGEPLSCSELWEAEREAHAAAEAERCRRQLEGETFQSAEAEAEAMARWECLCGIFASSFNKHPSCTGQSAPDV